MSALRYASLGEYIDFLRVYFASGGSASHYYDYPFAQHKFLIATRDFRTGGECGSLSQQIIVPAGIRHIGGDLGHNTLYLFDGPVVVGGFVPVYSDAAFGQFPQTQAAYERDRANEARWLEEKRQREAERQRRAAGSDLAPFSMRGRK